MMPLLGELNVDVECLRVGDQSICPDTKLIKGLYVEWCGYILGSPSLLPKIYPSLRYGPVLCHVF